MLHRKNHNLLMFFLTVLLMLTALEANAQVLDNINDSYKSATGGWLGNILPIAKSLFWKLAAIEFAWSAIVWALQQENMQSFTAVVVKKIMGIGFFYALLLNAGDWIPAIINSFTKAGQTASGSAGLSPSSVIDMGINSANVLLNALHDKSIWDDFMTIVIGGLSALGIVIAFTIIAGQLLVALVESYIVISAGVLFLGFGGARWTTDFTQKYLSYAVGTGVKLFMLYLIIGLGMTLTTLEWTM
jgi:type IV secretion system protein TrbL